MLSKIALVCISLVINLCVSYAQTRAIDLKQTVFTFNKELTDKYFVHTFTARTSTIPVYSNRGNQLTMKKGDRYGVLRIVNGNYKGYSGVWLEFYDLAGQPHSSRISYYARFDQLKDLKPENDKAYAEQLAQTRKLRQARFWDNTVFLLKWIGVGIVILGLMFLFFPKGVSMGHNMYNTRTFIGDGTVRRGESDGLGGINENFTDKSFRPKGPGTYTSKK